MRATSGSCSTRCCTRRATRSPRRRRRRRRRRRSRSTTCGLNLPGRQVAAARGEEHDRARRPDPRRAQGRREAAAGRQGGEAAEAAAAQGALDQEPPDGHVRRQARADAGQPARAWRVGREDHARAREAEGEHPARAVLSLSSGAAAFVRRRRGRVLVVRHLPVVWTTRSTPSPARSATVWSTGRGRRRAVTTRRSGSRRWWSARRACSIRATRDALAARVAERAVGLGPLEPLLRDRAVDEIMVCGTGPVWVERGGRLEATPARFGSEAELRHAIERILAPLGRRADEAEPLADARLPDGSRVHVVLPPLALDGPVLTIRRFRPRGFAPADLVAAGTLRRAAARVPRAARCAARCTLLICGGTGSGKTTTLGALAAFVDPGERVVTIEDAAELRLAAAARRPARGAAAEPGGPRRGDDPAARAQRAADAAGPAGRGGGARPGGARSAARDGHRPRRLALHDPRREAPPRRSAGSRRWR